MQLFKINISALLLFFFLFVCTNFVNIVKKLKFIKRRLQFD